MLIGVKYLYENKFLYCDLKLLNVLYIYIKGKGRFFLKIFDFGFSKNFGVVMLFGFSVFYFNVGLRCWMVLEFLFIRFFVYLFELDIFVIGFILYYLLVKGYYFFEGSNFI